MDALILKRVKYGRWQNLFTLSNDELIEDEVIDDDVIDVTQAVQQYVVNDQLAYFEASKATMEGVWNPCCKKPYELGMYIRYQW